MKRFGVITLMAVALTSTATLEAQDRASRAAAIAEREAAEERYRLLNSSIQGLMVAQSEQQKRLDVLAQDVRKLQLDSASSSRASYVTPDQLEDLVKQIQEIEQKRQADRKFILSEIRKLGDSIAESLKEISQKSPGVTSQAGTDRTTTKWPDAREHTIQQGETLSAIVTAYNGHYSSQGKKTSLKLIEQANPGIKPTSLRIGEVVIIPLIPN